MISYIQIRWAICPQSGLINIDYSSLGVTEEEFWKLSQKQQNKLFTDFMMKEKEVIFQIKEIIPK